MYMVYVIQERWELKGKKKFGQVKIGVTKDINSRLASMQTGNPRSLHCLCLFAPIHSQYEAYELEKRLHKLFKNERLRGEWFSAKIANEAYKICGKWNTFRDLKTAIDEMKRERKIKRKEKSERRVQLRIVREANKWL